LEKQILILNDFNSTLKKRDLQGHINFTGGDVFLRENDFWALIEKTVRLNIGFSVLGNPELLTADIALRLSNLNIKFYQLSLDGLETNHDFLRGAGSFKKALKAIGILKDVGIKTSIMFTLSKNNADDLIAVMRLVSSLGVDAFSFDRQVNPNGNRGPIRDLTKNEYKTICFLYLRERKKLKSQSIHTNFTLKSNLLKLALHQNPKLKSKKHENLSSKEIYNGCPVGHNGLAISSNGQVYLCSRLPLVAGDLTKMKLENIVQSSLFKSFSNKNNYKKCMNCKLYEQCRGCPAIAYAKSGDPFGPDPDCWNICN